MRVFLCVYVFVYIYNFIYGNVIIDSNKESVVMENKMGD